MCTVRFVGVCFASCDGARQLLGGHKHAHTPPPLTSGSSRLVSRRVAARWCRNFPPRRGDVPQRDLVALAGTPRACDRRRCACLRLDARSRHDTLPRPTLRQHAAPLRLCTMSTASGKELSTRSITASRNESRMKSLCRRFVAWVHSHRTEQRGWIL